ncbi:hypothetical protein F4604DRAFT_1944167 [Suillus subluteus]|nr:hypothetical protein F4604DRAFT_1944167 [Suillus subluteus]
MTAARMQPNEPVIPGALANVPERPLIEKTEKAEHHYLRRQQIWAKEADPTKQTPAQGWNDPAQGWGAPPVEYAWQPYDPSSIQPAPPREDVDNYFYLNVQYTYMVISEIGLKLVEILLLSAWYISWRHLLGLI